MEVLCTLPGAMDIESHSCIFKVKVVGTYIIQLLLFFSTFVDIHIDQVILSLQTLILVLKNNLN